MTTHLENMVVREKSGETEIIFIVQLNYQ